MRTFPRFGSFYVGSLAAQAWVLPSLFLSRFPYGSPLPGGEDPPPCRRRSLSPVRRLRHTTATLPTSGAQCNRRVRVAVADASALWGESCLYIYIRRTVRMSRIPGVTQKRAFSPVSVWPQVSPKPCTLDRRAYGGRKILRNAVPTPFPLEKSRFPHGFPLPVGLRCRRPTQ